MVNNLNDIRDKYLSDIAQIKNYISYLESFFVFSIAMTKNLGEISPTFSMHPNINNLCDNNAVIRNEMAGYIDKIHKEMNELDIKELNPEDPTSDDSTPQGDILLYLCMEIRKGNRNKQGLIQIAQTVVEAMCIAKGEIEGFEEYSFLYDHPTEIERCYNNPGIYLCEVMICPYKLYDMI